MTLSYTCPNHHTNIVDIFDLVQQIPGGKAQKPSWAMQLPSAPNIGWMLNHWIIWNWILKCTCIYLSIFILYYVWLGMIGQWRACPMYEQSKFPFLPIHLPLQIYRSTRNPKNILKKEMCVCVYCVHSLSFLHVICLMVMLAMQLQEPGLQYLRVCLQIFVLTWTIASKLGCLNWQGKYSTSECNLLYVLFAFASWWWFDDDLY